MLINYIWLKQNNSRAENACNVKLPNLFKAIKPITLIKKYLKQKCTRNVVEIWVNIFRDKSYKYVVNIKLVIPNWRIRISNLIYLQ